MHRFTTFIRTPVKRQGAESYLLTTLISFAASVSLTRGFLELTGYPQIGGEELHIAHALWGGLLLFVAALLPLIVANRWAFMASAVLTGIGVGLFIDEVGKFITQSNDYFYPLAAPIVYAFFLLTVVIYLRVRRPSERSPRAELYRAFDMLEELLEQDLDEQERSELEAMLRHVAETTDQPALKRLAGDINTFLHSDVVTLAQRRPRRIEVALARWQKFEATWMTRRRARAVIGGALFVLGLSAFTRMASAVRASALPFTLGNVITQAIETGDVPSAPIMIAYTNLGLQVLVSLLLLIAAGAFLLGKDRAAVTLGYYGLALSLTAGNLLVFYLNQFSSIAIAAIQLALLIAIGYYRHRFRKAPGLRGEHTTPAPG